MKEPIQNINSENAPEAIGPYSQAIQAGDFLFISGQLPLDLTTKKLIEGDIERMTHQVIDHLEAILKAANLTLENVIKTEVYLQDMGDFQAMNRAYSARFAHKRAPARQAMQVAKLPLNAPIEISCIAYSGK